MPKSILPFLIILILSSCGENQNTESEQLSQQPNGLNTQIINSPTQEQENLIATKKGELSRHNYCGHCHGVPEADSLPKESWPETLRRMNMLFVYPNRMPKHSEKIPKDFIYDQNEFINIGRYYVETAQSKNSIRKKLEKSEFKILPQSTFKNIPIVFPAGSIQTLLDYSNSKKTLIVGGIGNRGFGFRVFDSNYKTINHKKSTEAPIAVSYKKDSCFLTTMGAMDTDKNTSSVIEYNTKSWAQKEKIHISSAPRTTNILRGDFDNDGTSDIFLCGFGDNSGKGESFIYWGQKNNSYKKESILKRNGALKVISADLNNDNKLDFLVLLAQEHQSLLYFKNIGKRKYKVSNIITRPIGWGFMDFEYIDINNDGRKDIVTVVGNNMELKSNPLKPFHGVHIWNHVRGAEFKEEQFIYMQGASQIEIADFNGDHKMDIACTALAPDWEQSNPTTFGVWLQDSNKRFNAYSFAKKDWSRFCLLTTRKQKNNTLLLLLSSSLPISLPQNPNEFLQKKLAQPSQLIQLNLFGL
jgi:hypothetical protein